MKTFWTQGNISYKETDKIIANKKSLASKYRGCGEKGHETNEATRL